MIDALYSAATGMRAQQTSLDAIANNLANATTTGFKRDRVDLVDLEYVTFTLPSPRISIASDCWMPLACHPPQLLCNERSVFITRS